MHHNHVKIAGLLEHQYSFISKIICVGILSRWWFAGGLYMMKLAPENLRLTAMYGLIIAASVICFGASVGNWIDKTRRITGI